MAKILVIEDEWSILEEIRDMLEFDGHEVFVAENGVIGIAQAKQNLPDLILSDIMMPELDGYGVYQALSQNFETARIPFIFLTALASTEHVRQGMNLGVDDYLSKPFDYEMLTSAVQARLAKQGRLEKIRLEEFARKLIATRETELTQLAEKIEKNIAPLQGLQLLFSTMKPSTSSTEGAFLTRAHNTLQATLQSFQSLIQDFSPQMISHIGLVASLYWLIEHRVGEKGATLEIEMDEGLDTLPQHLKYHLYRLVGELLNFAELVSDMTILTLRIHLEAQTLHINFIAEQPRAAVSSDHMQLHPMEMLHHYIALLNGTYESDHNQAITVRITIPLEAETHRRKGNVPAKIRRSVAPHSPADYQILIAHDSAFVLEGLQGIFDKHLTSFQTDKAHTVQDVLYNLETIPVQILIIGISLDGQKLIDLIQIVREQAPDLKIIAISPYEEEIYALELFKRGIHGYLLLSSELQELVAAVEAVIDNKRFISKALRTDLLDLYSKFDNNSTESIAYDSLTDRERQIMLLSLEGLSPQEIAQTLSISPRTAETHRYNLMKKLGVSSQYELIRYAMRHNLYKFSD